MELSLRNTNLTFVQVIHGYRVRFYGALGPVPHPIPEVATGDSPRSQLPYEEQRERAGCGSHSARIVPSIFYSFSCILNMDIQKERVFGMYALFR